MAPSLKPKNLGIPPTLEGGRFENGAVVYEKDIGATNGAAAFEAELAGWLARYVSRQSVVPLMSTADGLPQIKAYIQSAPVNLSGKRHMTMHLFWDKLSNGQWFVEGVGFSLRDNMANIYRANHAALMQRLQDKAEREAERRGPPEWKLWFDPSMGGANWLADAAEGQRLVDAEFPAAHKVVKQLVPMLKNPIGPDMDSDESILKELGKAVAGSIPGKFGEGWSLWDAQSKLREQVNSPDKLKAVTDTMDLGLPLVFAEAGPVPALASQIIGSFIDIAIASDAGRVSKERGRLYMFFVSGFLSNIFKPAFATPAPPKKRDAPARAVYYMEKLVHEFGEKRGAVLNARQKYLVQLALLHFVATHNTENEWNFQNRMDKGWQHPTHYTAYWSKELLVRAFMWQFFKGKYRYK